MNEEQSKQKETKVTKPEREGSERDRSSDAQTQGGSRKFQKLRDKFLGFFGLLSKEQRASGPKKWRHTDIISLFFLLLFSLILLLGVRTLRTYQVDGLSMAPTFENGDRLFIHKEKQPERYDLVTFFPKAKEQTSYVKRVVGMPGDKLRTEGNALYINQELYADGRLNEGLAAKELPDGTLKVTITKNVWEQLSELEEIPADSYFVLGDNRGNSTDSRHLGLIKKGQIDGVVVFRYYPFDSFGLVK